MSVYLDINSLYPHLKVNWNVLMCKICIAWRLIVDIFPWCNANFVPFPSGTLVARRMRTGELHLSDCTHSFFIQSTDGTQKQPIRAAHRLIKTQIGHARDFTWYRGQRPSPARVILSHERVQIHARENLCSYTTNPPHFCVRELLLCDI